MSPNEIALFTVLIGLGTVAGSVFGVIAAKKARGIAAARIRALIVSVVVPLIYCFIAGLFESPRSMDFSIMAAIWAGVAFMLLYGCAMSLISGSVSLIFFSASYAIFNRFHCTSKK